VAMNERDCICDRFAPVTEAAALAAAEWIGRGDGLAAGLAARRAMSDTLASMPISARVIAGRASAQPSDGLSVGDRTGSMTDDSDTWELAVKALEAHEALARGLDGALSMIAVGPSGSLMAVPEMYMQKIVVGGRAADAIDIDAPIGQNVEAVSSALGRRPQDLTVVVLDRPRHEDIIEEIKGSGARLKLIDNGDVSAGIAAAVDDTDIDLCIGVGGSTEGIITAAAMRSLGGEIQARLWPVSRYQVEAVRTMGINDLEATLTSKEMAGEGVLVAATAVTRGRFLRGVEKRSDGVRTETMLMCSRCHKIKLVRTIHRAQGTTSPVALWTL
jgi:fructose-1,6-bisphosphatase II